MDQTSALQGSFFMKKNIKIRLNYTSDKVFLLMFGSPNVKIFDKS